MIQKCINMQFWWFMWLLILQGSTISCSCTCAADCAVRADQEDEDDSGHDVPFRMPSGVNVIPTASDSNCFYDSARVVLSKLDPTKYSSMAVADFSTRHSATTLS